MKGAGILDTRENCWKFFIDRVRRQLKVVLCFSPVGSTLRVRSRKFPALINCTSIVWFHEWPQEALISVSVKFLQELDVLPVSSQYLSTSTREKRDEMKSFLSLTRFKVDYRESVAKFMAHVHSQVNTISRTYLHNEKRFNYTTPKSFLEQINLYSKLLKMKFSELSKKIERLENGLDKLKKTAAQVTRNRAASTIIS